ncbi:MAG: DUF3800 domain-containing protein [Clostridia bacterium]|nr:DUF3800 domain-containing protein [Clostridia bacterium]
MNEPIVRMFVDENGHQSLKGDLTQSDKRFLCMTGVIMQIREHDTMLTPMLNDLKEKYFGNAQIVLHRRELIPAKPPFEVLKDDFTREEFNHDLLQIVEKVQYRVISVVIDKLLLVQKYGLIRAQDPYALALEFLMQRYQYWMQDYKALYGSCMGDILAEARGGGEDRITKTAYHEIYSGKGYNSLKNAGEVFSSSQIKLKPKVSNIAGLQFADLLSHPARRYILSQNGLSSDIKASSYEQKIVDILVASKFRRTEKGIIDGPGVVLYPR